MDSKEIIALYENVSHITDQMVAAAHAGDWNELTALETRCAIQIARLDLEGPHAILPMQERSQKVKILKKILADDREIRIFTEPWMTRLSSLMSTVSTHRGKPSQPYSPSSTN